MKVTRVLHVSRNAEGRLAETQTFYAELFGLGSIPRPDIPGVAGHWFGVGEAELHLVDAPGGVEDIRPTGDHWCFGVDDIESAIEELRVKGIDYVRGAQGDVVQIWIRDPAGGTVELQQDLGR